MPCAWSWSLTALIASRWASVRVARFRSAKSASRAWPHSFAQGVYHNTQRCSNEIVWRCVCSFDVCLVAQLVQLAQRCVRAFIFARGEAMAPGGKNQF